MVRLPRGQWQFFHPQARRGPDALAYRPGWRGSGQQPIGATPIGAYGGKISGVPLVGGQALGTIAGYPAASGSASSPTAFAVIAGPTFSPGGGSFTVAWTVSLSGTLSAADANNFYLFHNNTQIAQSTNADVAGTYPQTPVPVVLAPGDDLVILAASNNGTPGSVYGGVIAAAGSGSLTLQVAPQGLGTVWYPVQVTASTTTGLTPLGDNSVCNIYLGPAVIPNTLVGTVYNGNGTAALAIPNMSPGQSLVAVWAGANSGDTAAVNVTGTMDALTTG
jgi:hypothetical protein